MDRVEVTEGELVQALRQAQTVDSDDRGAMTTRELRKALGWGADRVREHLHELSAGGRLEVVKVWRMQLDGVTRRTTGYRLTDNNRVEGAG